MTTRETSAPTAATTIHPALPPPYQSGNKRARLAPTRCVYRQVGGSQLARVRQASAIARHPFFERQRRRAGHQVEIMKDHLTRQSNLIFFPEGTSTPGTHVTNFRSSLFAAAADGDTYIQPITIAYSHYNNRRMEQAERDSYAWYITMPFLSHFLNGLGLGPASVALICHEPVKLADQQP